jgi:putative ABC transport system ATP-binding protein
VSNSKKPTPINRGTYDHAEEPGEDLPHHRGRDDRDPRHEPGGAQGRVRRRDGPVGEYWFDGQNIAGYSESRLSELRKNAIGFVFQSFNLIDELNVAENVELALLYHREVSTGERKKRAAEALERMKIGHRARHMPSQLSGGQQQRVAVARAVVARPKLILADEPTGNLDTANGEEVMQLLTQLNDEGTTIVMVTHSHSHAEYAHRIVNLLDGAIVTESIRQVL